MTITIRECEGKMQISRIEFPHQHCISVWNQNLPCNRIVSLSYPSISKVILIVDDSFDFKACVIWCHHARSIWLWQGSRNGDQFTILRNIWVHLLTFYQSRHLKQKKKNNQVSNFTGFLTAKNLWLCFYQNDKKQSQTDAWFLHYSSNPTDHWEPT